MSKLEEGDKFKIQQHLFQFKNRGIIQFDKVLAIPTTERIPALIREPDGFTSVCAVLTASIKSAFENINLRVGLNEDQMAEIAGMVIDESEDDNLSLEDVLIFLKELLGGKMGKIYDRMDIPTFFELFEKYRQQRHLAVIRIREEQAAQYGALPMTERFSEDAKNDEKNAFHEAMKEYVKNKPQE